MNLMIVIPDGLKVLESKMSPIMKCFGQDNCLLLFIPRLEGLKQSKWGFLLQILELKIRVNMVTYNVQGSIFLLFSQRCGSSLKGVVRVLDGMHYPTGRKSDLDVHGPCRVVVAIKLE